MNGSHDKTGESLDVFTKSVNSGRMFCRLGESILRSWRLKE
jgi:hypothetical protein